VSRTSTGSSSPRRGAEPPGTGVPHRPADVAATLARLGVVPSKRFGQSFLLDPFVADAEVALLEARPGEPVLEIGGGLGLLTEALVRRGVNPLTVVERDPLLADHLRRTFGERIEVVEGDALEVEWPAVGKVAANLPFSVATPILERAWAAGIPRFVGMLQREVAERLACGPGSKVYGRLSIMASLYGSVELFQVVPATSFHPEPAVEGRVFRFDRRPGELPVPDVPRFETQLHALFSARRKQLGNLLPRVMDGRFTPQEAARDSGWPEDWATRRPEALAPEAYFALARRLGHGASRRHRPVPPAPQA
jgi:16S rRNA (adenine1518-N6/adenine1519-N6)-dimethyltransferase